MNAHTTTRQHFYTFSLIDWWIDRARLSIYTQMCGLVSTALYRYDIW